jgi:hypothetical protein
MKIPVALLVGLVFLTGCEIVPSYQPVDYGKTRDGKSFIRDTPRSWNYFKEDTDKAIASELKGVAPGGGMKSWNDNWVRVIRNIRNGGQENPERYVAYIVHRRRELALPEIVVPPNESQPSR